MSASEMERLRAENTRLREQLDATENYRVLALGDERREKQRADEAEAATSRALEALRLAVGALHAAGYDDHPDAVRARTALSGSSAPQAAATPEDLKAATLAKDAAYAERNQCVALIARMARALGWRAGIGIHEDKPGEAWEPDWRTLVCIDLPTGQVSWHFHDSHRWMLHDLPPYPLPWDGHDTSEKYRRVRAALSMKSEGPAAPEDAEGGGR